MEDHQKRIAHDSVLQHPFASNTVLEGSLPPNIRDMMFFFEGHSQTLEKAVVQESGLGDDEVPIRADLHLPEISIGKRQHGITSFCGESLFLLLQY